MKLLGLEIKPKSKAKFVLLDVKFNTVYPDIKLEESEWMERFNVGKQYCIFRKTKPQETVTMMDIYKKTFVEGVVEL